MSQTTTERIARTATTVVANLQTQLDEGIRKLSEVLPEGQAMSFKHPQGMDKPGHFAVFERQSQDTYKLVGVYQSDYPKDAIEAAGNKSDLIVVNTLSLWQPVSI